jgi:aspartate/methionine/tyrosine aminotransferase
MHNNLASRLDHIAPFHVMELMKMASTLEEQGRHLIHMGIGEPDFTAPQTVIDAAAKAMADGRLQYTSALGLPALREAIATYYLQQYGLTIPASRIIVTAGASAALLLACAALVEPGKEVLMPDPCYPCNRHFVAAFNGQAKLVASGAEDRFSFPIRWCVRTGVIIPAAYYWHRHPIQRAPRSAPPS